ncbi:hypothetical protein [Nocardiopsis rhodophaea]|uniref:hypothetical protein n=1 Tax=Nocardiopsis rhodophaea TaxID=280238 RepID=UPI0031D2B2BB
MWRHSAHTRGEGGTDVRPRRRGTQALATAAGALLLLTIGAVAAPNPATGSATASVLPVAGFSDHRPKIRSGEAGEAVGRFRAQPGGPDSSTERDVRPCFHPHWVTVAVGDRVWRVHGRSCPDWAPNGRIPLFARPAAESRIVGHLDPERDAWYHCQDAGSPFHLGNAVTRWWAVSRTANGHSGWVPQVYFRGAPPGAADSGLEFCGQANGRDAHDVAPPPIALPLPSGLAAPEAGAG